jgi:hypothetical protein
MTYKNKSERKKHYEKNKEEINRKRREYNKRPEVHEKILEVQGEWRKNNRARANELSRISKKKYEARCKELIFNHYGKVCACCGESNPMFLSIDHINGGGTKQRKEIKREKITTWLVRNNFPKGFQTLCFNCNWGKHINHGICPHKDTSLKG